MSVVRVPLSQSATTMEATSVPSAPMKANRDSGLGDFYRQDSSPTSTRVFQDPETVTRLKALLTEDVLKKSVSVVALAPSLDGQEAERLATELKTLGAPFLLTVVIVPRSPGPKQRVIDHTESSPVPGIGMVPVNHFRNQDTPIPDAEILAARGMAEKLILTITERDRANGREPQRLLLVVGRSSEKEHAKDKNRHLQVAQMSDALANALTIENAAGLQNLLENLPNDLLDDVYIAKTKEWLQRVTQETSRVEKKNNALREALTLEAMNLRGFIRGRERDYKKQEFFEKLLLHPARRNLEERLTVIENPVARRSLTETAQLLSEANVAKEAWEKDCTKRHWCVEQYDTLQELVSGLDRYRDNSNLKKVKSLLQTVAQRFRDQYNADTLGGELYEARQLLEAFKKK